jgi:hypothetical protein
MCEVWSAHALNAKIICFWVMTLWNLAREYGPFGQIFTNVIIEDVLADSSKMIIPINKCAWCCFQRNRNLISNCFIIARNASKSNYSICFILHRKQWSAKNVDYWFQDCWEKYGGYYYTGQQKIFISEIFHSISTPHFVNKVWAQGGVLGKWNK